MIARPEQFCALVNRGSFHGDALVIAYGSRTRGNMPGLPDSVWFAEQALLEGEKRAWIRRGDYDPSPSQRVLGLGGFAGNMLARLAPEHRSPAAFHWITVTTKYLEPEDCRCT